MSTVAVGSRVPPFTATDADGRPWKLIDARGSRLVLYFYPRDMTSGCTLEARSFRDLHGEFRRAGVSVVGISRDSAASHQKFRSKENLGFELLSDEDETLCRLFDVIRDRNMYGRKVRGIERSTFLIDEAGTLVRAWRKVKVAGHAAEVLQAAKSL